MAKDDPVDEYHPYGKGKEDITKKPTRKEAKKRELKTDSMVAREQIRSVVERVERLEEEKKAIGDDIKDVYAEAKANGFDTKILKQVIKLRKMDLAERQEQDAIRDLYLQALGMLPDFEGDA